MDPNQNTPYVNLDDDDNFPSNYPSYNPSQNATFSYQNFINQPLSENQPFEPSNYPFLSQNPTHYSPNVPIENPNMAYQNYPNLYYQNTTQNFPLFSSQQRSHVPHFSLSDHESGTGSTPQASRSMPSLHIDLNDQAGENDEDVVVEVPAAAAKKTVTKTAWDQTHDESLISSWLFVSKDPIVGNNQSADTYWERITGKLNEYCPDVVRKPHAVKCHWAETSRKVTKFNGCYIRSTQRAKSGWVETDYMKSAHDLYRSENGTRFKHEFWWRLVHKEPKWVELYQTEPSNKKTRINEQGEFTTSGERTSGGDNANTSRPSGRETAKKKKGKGKCRGSDGADDSLINDILETQKESNRIQKEKTEAFKGLGEKTDALTQAHVDLIKVQRNRDLRKWIEMDTSNMSEIEKEVRENVLKDYLNRR